MERTHRIAPALGVFSLVALAACGTSGTSSSSGGGGSGGLSGCHGSVTVASDLPTSGGDAAIGGGTENGVRLAIEQAKASHLLGGCDINYIAKDDASAAKGKHDPQQGAQNVTELANNPAVVGLVGPFNSSVAVAELPISNAKGLVQISPSNTDPGLTIPGSDPDIDTKSLQPSGKITYFRVISNDVVQAQVMAQVATKELHLQNVYVIDDQETYGKDLANYFVQFYQQGGGKVAGRSSLPGDTKDFRPVLNTAKGQAVDGVFFGGTASNGSGIIKTNMKDIGLNTYLLSGDGTVDPQYFKDAAAAASTPPGALASSAPDTTKLGSAQGFVSTYKSRFGSDAVAYSTYGYDCMNILLQAVKKVLTDNGGQIPTDPQDFRTKVVAAVQASDYKGAIGETKFDNRGDTLNHAFTVYQATGSGASGTWAAKETISPQSSS